MVIHDAVRSVFSVIRIAGNNLHTYIKTQCVFLASSLIPHILANINTCSNRKNANCFFARNRSAPTVNSLFLSIMPTKLALSNDGRTI